jgi:hypothetical protein
VEPFQGSGPLACFTQGGGDARKTRFALPWATVFNAFGVRWTPGRLH